MNRQDAKPAKEEPDHELDLLAEPVIGAAIEVHRPPGPGYLESIDEDAPAIEFRIRNLPFERQYPIGVAYRSFVAGQSRPDFLVGLRLGVEIEAVGHLLPVHRAQAISCPKATNCRPGITSNFHQATLARGVRRIVWTS